MLFCLSLATVALAFGDVPYFRAADRLPDLSYGIFPLHWPVLLGTTLIWPQATAAVALSSLLISILLSIPLHYLIEEPARRFRYRRRAAAPIDAAPRTAV